jgi:hypothetical protein
LKRHGEPLGAHGTRAGPRRNDPDVRRAIVAVLVAACVLSGCKEPAPVGSAEIQGSTNVEMHGSKYVPTQSSNMSSGTNDQFYVICKITFTNTLGYDTAPEPKNFILQDPIGNQFVGVDSGDAALIGISNYGGLVKKDQKQDYTVAFRIPPNTSGSVFYSPF